jgi:HEAT repeat protein
MRWCACFTTVRRQFARMPHGRSAASASGAQRTRLRRFFVMNRWGLGELEVRKASDALAEVLASDKSPRVRGTAAWALGELNPGPAPKSLVTALRDADEDVRLKAAWALSQIADPNTANDISAALKVEQRDRVRQALVRGLIETGENSADAFKDMLDSKDQKTREVAVRALAGRRSPWPWPWPQPRPRPFP